MKYQPILLIAISVLLVGAGCTPTKSPSPAANAPSANAPAMTGPKGNTNAAPAQAGAGMKLYTSAPYDFSYPKAYTLTDHPMTEAARKPYLDKGLDAPLQLVTLATVTRPPGFTGEGPPSIAVIQWNNAQRTPLLEWAKKQSGYTNFTGANKNLSNAQFLGHPSLAYDYDGLYGGKARLIDLDGTVLQISADFDADAGNTNMAAFDTILSTLSLSK